jgi:hypothetical protein
MNHRTAHPSRGIKNNLKRTWEEQHNSQTHPSKTHTQTNKKLMGSPIGLHSPLVPKSRKRQSNQTKKKYITKTKRRISALNIYIKRPTAQQGVSLSGETEL